MLENPKNVHKFGVLLKSGFFSTFCVFGSYFRTLSVSFVADFVVGGGGGGGSDQYQKIGRLFCLLCFVLTTVESD